MKYYVCNGRLAFDDEDAMEIIEAKSADDASDVFELGLRDACAADCEYCAKWLAADGDPAEDVGEAHDFLLNSVIECDTKPRVVYSSNF